MNRPALIGGSAACDSATQSASGTGSSAGTPTPSPSAASARDTSVEHRLRVVVGLYDKSRACLEQRQRQRLTLQPADQVRRGLPGREIGSLHAKFEQHGGWQDGLGFCRGWRMIEIRRRLDTRGRRLACALELQDWVAWARPSRRGSSMPATS